MNKRPDWPARSSSANADGTLFAAPAFAGLSSSVGLSSTTDHGQLTTDQLPYTGQRLAGCKVRRLGGQNQQLLERLRRGPCTNTEMIQQMNICKYTSRISDLRKKYGCTIECEEGDNGVSTYRLISELRERN